MEDQREAFSIRRYEASDRETVWKLHNAALETTGAYLGKGKWDDDLHDIEGACLEDYSANSSSAK